MVDESVSERLVHQAVDIIFSEFERYNKIINMFDGIDWATYQKKKGENVNYKEGRLLDEV